LIRMLLDAEIAAPVPGRIVACKGTLDPVPVRPSAE